jgi:membrane protease YdiL (CAAX protease family)
MTQDEHEDKHFLPFILNGKEIAQIDATIIAGALIFLTVASLNFIPLNLGPLNRTIAVFIILPFATSLMSLLTRRRPFEPKWGSEGKTARFGCFFGVAILVGVLVYLVLIPSLLSVR